MIKMRRAQLNLGDGLIADEVADLREDWMKHADEVLKDEQLLATVYEALAKRRPKSRSLGRSATPAEVVLRLLILKHVRNWSCNILEREGRANLVYRDFTRVDAAKMPDAKTTGHWGRVPGPKVIKQVHARMVQIAHTKQVVEGRRMRTNTTVTETNIQHPTDSSFLGDGVRVLTCTMKKITEITGEVGTEPRDRSRSVKLRALDIARAARSKAKQSQGKRQQNYRKLLESTTGVVGQAKRFSKEIADSVKLPKDPLKQLALDGLRQEMDTMVPRIKQVMNQTCARIFHGDTHYQDKIFSLFEPSTEIIRKGKAAKLNEFGKVVKVQEAENQIVIDYEVYDRRPNDADLLLPAIETHQAALGRTPHLVAAAFYSDKNEKAAKAKGVKRVCVPNRSTKSAARKREQKKRWFRNGQKWRTGCEGRISVVKRRHGLSRCRYKGDDRMKPWVGFGVIAENLIHIGGTLAKRDAEANKAAQSQHPAS